MPSTLFRLTLTLLAVGIRLARRVLVDEHEDHRQIRLQVRHRGPDDGGGGLDRLLSRRRSAELGRTQPQPLYVQPKRLYSPKVEADVGPDMQWVLDVQLANPDEWAMVTATAAPPTQTPNIHCDLAVDGVVVATDAGPRGALSSIRNW